MTPTPIYSVQEPDIDPRLINGDPDLLSTDGVTFSLTRGACITIANQLLNQADLWERSGDKLLERKCRFYAQFFRDVAHWKSSELRGEDENLDDDERE